MKISDLAAQTGIAPSAIRFYESSGLLPEARRGTNRYRQYDASTLQRLLVIQLAQRLGFSLDSLRAVLVDADGMPHDVIIQRMDQRLQEIEAMEASLRIQRKEILALKARLQAEWVDGRCLELAPADLSSIPAPVKRRARRGVAA